MRVVRAVLVAVPVLLLALFGASFASVRLMPLRVKNQMVSASIGEPKLLNPIQAADAAAGEVLDLVFDGLLSLDENLELEGRLAESWAIAQTSTLFFAGPAEAQRAAEEVARAGERRAGWALLREEVAGDALLLHFAKPGTAASREVLAHLASAGIAAMEVRNVRVDMKGSARESFEVFLSAATRKGALRRTWFDYNAAVELAYAGPEAAEFDAELREHYKANAGLEARVTALEALPCLDEPEIHFKLRRGVKWHDGAPFDARDVLFTYRRIMDEQIVSPRKPDYDAVRSVEAPTPNDVRVIYRRPFSPALNSWMIGVLPEHLLGGKDADWWAAHFNRSPVGTGPFRFGRWLTNQFVELDRNPDYFRGAPHLEKAVFRVIPDATSIRLAFETRQSDFWGADPHAVGRYGKDRRFDVFASPGGGYTYVGWNLRRPMFQDVRVRRALAHAVDVDAIIRYVLYGHGARANGPWDPRTWWHDASVAPLPHDVAEARRLLAEAGWVAGPDGVLAKGGERFSFTLITNNANEVRRDIATLVQASLREVGIEVEVQLYEWAVFLSQFIDKGEFDACVLGWTFGIDYDQYQIWHSSQTGPGQLNFVGYRNPEVDRLLERIRGEYDRGEIVRMAGELQRAIYADQPYLFLYVPASTTVMWKGAYRVARPAAGAWLDEPLRVTKAGLAHYREYFYRPQHRPSFAP